MEQFKDVLETRVKFLMALVPMTALLIVGASLYSQRIMPVGMDGNDFIRGFQTGIFLGVEIILLRFLVTYRKGLKDDQKLKELYIKETDERNKFIANQVGHMGFHIVFIGLAIATIIAGFFDRSVFSTLFAAVIFIALVKGSLKLYFRTKY